MAKKITLATIASMLTQHGKEIKDLTESVGFVVKHMATKDDIAQVRNYMATKDQVLALQTQVNSIEQQLPDTKTQIRLGNLEEKVFGEARR